MIQRSKIRPFNSKTETWWSLLFRWRGSVIPTILPQVALCAVFSFIVSLIDAKGFNLGFSLAGGIVPSIVLGLLLVFRTNTAYERFWEGRKLWGNIVNASRNLARTIWVSIEENKPQDREKKIATLRLIIAFAVSTKLHLRSENIDEKLYSLIAKERFEKLKTMNNPPLEIAFWIGDYVQQEHDRKNINSHQLIAILQLLDILVDCLGGCERILKTPIPLAYAVHLKQLLFIYCLALPFQIVNDLALGTALFVGLVSFTVFGIEAIGIEIENPFGHDSNDLPLDQICETMERNIEDLISLYPCVRHWQREGNIIIEDDYQEMDSR